MKVSDVVLQTAVGLLIGAGVGAVVGFVTFALGETLNPSGGFVILMPSGPLGVGLLGAVMMGVVGVVIGLIVGALSLRVPSAAALGILIFLLLKARNMYLDMGSPKKSGANRGLISMNMGDVMILINLVMIAVLVALALRQLFEGRSRYL